MLWHCWHYQSKPVSIAESHQLENNTEIKVIITPQSFFFFFFWTLTIPSASKNWQTTFTFWLYFEFLTFQNNDYRFFFPADEKMCTTLNVTKFTPICIKAITKHSFQPWLHCTFLHNKSSSLPPCFSCWWTFLNAMQHHTTCKTAIGEHWLSFQPWDWGGGSWQYLILQLSSYLAYPLEAIIIVWSHLQAAWYCLQVDSSENFLPFHALKLWLRQLCFYPFFSLKLLSAIICSSLVWWESAKEQSSLIFPRLNCSPNKLEAIYSH